MLGVTWNHDTDELRIDLGDIVKSSENLSVTKRTVLKVSTRVYDPLGWILPILSEMKLLFQKLCQSKVCQSKEDWNEELRTFVLIVSAHPYCVRKITPRHG